MNILAVDPGKATGIARMWNGEFKSTILPWYEAMQLIERDGKLYDLVVCEDYRISKQTLTKGADAHWAMGAIGIITYVGMREGFETIKQSPADAKSFSTDKKLKQLEWCTPGPGHDNDAARHLLLALVNRRAFDLNRLL